MIYTIRTEDRDRPARITPHGAGAEIDLDGQAHTVQVTPRAGTTQFTVTVDGVSHAVALTRTGPSVAVVIGPDRFAFTVIHGVAVPHAAAAAGGPVRRDIPAPMPGLIRSTAVAAGDTVEPGRVVAVMEAMKMQMEIRAPAGGRVVAVPVRAGDEVVRGAVLMTIETAEAEG